MNLSLSREEHRNAQILQNKANFLSKKIINHTQIATKKFGSCYIHQYLSSNRLHSVLCSYRHKGHEENDRPCNINKQKKVPKIPHIILSNSIQKVTSYPVTKNLRKSYFAKNSELKKKYVEEKVVNYTINCVSNNNKKFDFEEEDIHKLIEYKNELKADFSNFLDHYHKVLNIINNLEKDNTFKKTNEIKKEILLPNCSNKTTMTSLSMHNKDVNLKSQNEKVQNNNHRQRKMARFERIYEPIHEIDVPKLTGIGKTDSTDEDVEDDEQEEEEYIWEDESISEMYRNSQKPILQNNQILEDFNNEINSESHSKKLVSNKEDIIYSKRTSAGISTLRDIEYIPKIEEDNFNDHNTSEYPNADRSFTEYIETPRQYSSQSKKNLSNTSSSDNSFSESLKNVKSLITNQSNLKKWNNIELANKFDSNDISYLLSSKKLSNKSNSSIRSLSNSSSKNHNVTSNKSQNDVISYDEKLHELNYQLNEITNKRMSLTSINNDVSEYSFSSNNKKKQDFLMIKKKQRQDSISSQSNNSNSNISSKNVVFQRNTSLLSNISSGKLQQTNGNTNLISSKNDISELDSLRSSLSNTFNGDELIDNYIITSDKKNSFKFSNNSYEMKYTNNANSLSSISTLTGQIVIPTSNIDIPSLQDKSSASLSKYSDKKDTIRKNNFSPSKNQDQPTHITKMINEEPKTVNSTSSSTNLSSLKRSSSIKNVRKIEGKMPIYQTSQDSGDLKLISNLDNLKSNSEEVNSTDVIETLDEMNKSISTSDNNNLSNIQSLINAGNNIYLKDFNRNKNNELKENENGSLNYKFNLIFNDKNMNENSNLNNELLFSDISSITDTGNSIKNNKSDENNKSENLIEKDNINEEYINSYQMNQFKNTEEEDLSILSMSSKNEEKSIDEKSNSNNLSSSQTTESSNSTNRSKKTLSKSSSNKSSKNSSSISTMLSKSFSKTDALSSLSSLPSSATSLKD